MKDGTMPKKCVIFKNYNPLIDTNIKYNVLKTVTNLGIVYKHYD